ncbi:MAG: MarR family transcriptional regulator [Chloroflexi bacterium]|nr:MarR family transcriptional regulator [Chloroflexota bacterium]
MDAQELQEQMIGLVRAFGLHQPDRTPCGQPVSVSAAHALMELTQVESLPQTALAARLRLEKSTVSRLVEHLERRGWIRRERDPADRRVLLLHLTDAGRRASEQLAVARAAKFARIFSAIPAEERAAVQRGLSVLLGAVSTSNQRRTKHVAMDRADGAHAGGRAHRGLHGRADPRPDQAGSPDAALRRA